MLRCALGADLLALLEAGLVLSLVADPLALAKAGIVAEETLDSLIREIVGNPAAPAATTPAPGA